jgi:hypothetical protein
MSCHGIHPTHTGHAHAHGEGCGHLAIRHGDHIDYAHAGHLHHVHDDHVHDCALEVGAHNPAFCQKGHACTGHAPDHVHGEGCGHEAVPHGDHVCYVVEGHLHHPHGDHCDDHGAVELV